MRFVILSVFLLSACTLRHEPLEWEGWRVRMELTPFGYGRGWVDIDESERARVKLGQTAEVRAPGYPETFQAEVTEFAGEIDAIQGTLEARLFPNETPDWLVPGQTVDVNILLSTESERLLVPLTSVSLIGNGAKVLMVENGRLKEREVRVSSPTEKGYLIQSGVEAGEQVVRYPQGLKDGEKVRVERGDWP